VEVREGFVEILKTPQTQVKLAEAADGYYGRAFTWVIRGRQPDQSETKEKHQPGQSRPNNRRLVMEHPMVQQALEMLGGELIDIRALEKGKGKHGREEASPEN
jgi:DNA polymerase-3 subunit gamma/tau